MACDGNIACEIGSGLGDIVGAAGGAAQDAVLGPLGKTMLDGFDGILKDFMTSWLSAPGAVNFSQGTVSWFTNNIHLVTVMLAAIGIIIAGVRMMFAGNGQPARVIAKKVGTLMLIATAGTTIVQTLVFAGQVFTQWLLNSSGTGIDKFGIQTSSAAFVALTSPGLLLILGIIGILSVFANWGLMLFRNAVLPLLLAYWAPAAAGATITEDNGPVVRITRWIIAFVLYVPIVGGIYAFAWHQKSNPESVGDVIDGIVLIILAVFLLPALLKVLAPMAEAIGRATGGAIAAGVVVTTVAAGVAVGAAVATGGGSAAASGGGAAAASGGGAATGGGAPTGGGVDPGSSTGTGGGMDSDGPGKTPPAAETVASDSSTDSSSGTANGGTASAETASGTGGGSGSGWAGGFAAAGNTAQNQSNNNDSTAEGTISD